MGEQGQSAPLQSGDTGGKHTQGGERHELGEAEAHEEPHAHEMPVSLRNALTLLCVLVAAFILEHYDYAAAWDSGWRWWDRRILASYDEMAQRWTEELRTNVDDFSFSPKAAELAGPLLRLSLNADPKVSCTARLRLSTLYFASNKFEEAGSQLTEAEKLCADDAAVMEELYYVHGRAISAMADKAPNDIRPAYEVAAWKRYDKSWQYGRQHKNFEVVAVIQMCRLSSKRIDITAAELKDLEQRLENASLNPYIERRQLGISLTRQERIIRPMRVGLEANETQGKARIEDRPLVMVVSREQRRLIDSLQAERPTKRLTELFERIGTPKPVPVRKSHGAQQPVRHRSTRSRH